MRRLYPLGALACVLCAPASAQRLEDVNAGAKVRVWYGTPTKAVVRGTLLASDTVHVTVGSDRTSIERIPYQEITRFDFVASRRTADQAMARGMGHGAMLGLGASAIMVGGAALFGKPDPKICRDDCGSPVPSAIRGGLVLTAATALVGAIIGRQHMERWRTVRLPWS